MYTGGAHCCTVTKIVYQTNDGDWKIGEFGTRDGDPELKFEDVLNDGNFKIIGFDERFNYAFSSYAGSWPPIKIEEFQDGRLIDVTRNKRFLPRIHQALAEFEANAQADWNSNGYLAGWVALKTLVGEQDDAFKRIILLYDRADTFGLLRCKVSLKKYICPNDDYWLDPFPKALKQFLLRYNYLTSTTAAYLPSFDNMKSEPYKTVPAKEEISKNRTKALSDDVICRYAITNKDHSTAVDQWDGLSPADWDNNPLFSDYINEAHKRNFSIEDCMKHVIQANKKR